MIIILCGKSGCGKDTVLNHLVKDKIAQPIISTTTRPMREKEKQGREYNFVTRSKFLRMIEENKLLEYRTYNTTVNGVNDTWYYGSPVVDPDAADYVTVLDIDGAKTYIDKYGRNNCIVIMLSVPDNIRESRAIKRGSFDKTEWDRRCADDAVKFSRQETNGVINTQIENTENFNTVYSKIKTYIETHNKTKQTKQP